jgi:hypothetical protein
MVTSQLAARNVAKIQFALAFFPTVSTFASWRSPTLAIKLGTCGVFLYCAAGVLFATLQVLSLVQKADKKFLAVNFKWFAWAHGVFTVQSFVLWWLLTAS